MHQGQQNISERCKIIWHTLCPVVNRLPAFVIALCATVLLALTATLEPTSAQSRPQQAAGHTAAGFSGKPVEPAAVIGKVTDALTGEPLPDSDVLISKVGEIHKRKDVETGKDGSFALKNLEPGEWLLKVYGEKRLTKTIKLTLTPGQTKSLQIALEGMEPVETLKVTGKRKLINPAQLATATPLDQGFINHYKSGNNVQELLTSTPGILNDSYGNIITRGEHNAVNYMLDGVVMPEQAGALQQQQFVNPRSLQSMDVQVGGYSAADGGGPLGAIVSMKSLPIQSKPVANFGGQLGGPLAGSLYYNLSGALSQNPASILNRVRIESSGTAVGSSIYLQAGTKHFRRNNGANLNTLTKIEYLASERDKLKLTVGFNEAFLQVPIPGSSEAAGVRQHQHDRQDFAILSWHHKFAKWFDESNLHIVNTFDAESFRSRNVFDPTPIINGTGVMQSVAPQARRFDYALSAQGDISKQVFKTHLLKAGFLSELRPIRTDISAYYYNNSLTNGIPYGAMISPFTGTPDGPQFQHNGNVKGFRYLQSAYFQDKWTPQGPILKRLTLNAGVRFDLYHGVYGNMLAMAQTIAGIPGVMPFSIQPYLTQRVTDAQSSGRFGASYQLTDKTVLRASYSQLFEPPPVDIFVMPPDVRTYAVPGIFVNTPRPLRAARGQMVDVGVEQQAGPRLVLRNNMYYKELENQGDSGVVENTPIYNRQTMALLKSYGMETRVDLKTSREGYGLNGFLTSTAQVAYMGGSRTVTGGNWQNPTIPGSRYADHDRRYAVKAGLGYKAHNSIWVLGELGVYTGLQDQRNVEIFGAHPARTPVLTMLGLNFGWSTPKSWRKSALVPTSFDVRMDNLLNERIPVNLGSPFQGTRYSLPLRVLAGAYWKL